MELSRLKILGKKTKGIQHGMQEKRQRQKEVMKRALDYHLYYIKTGQLLYPKHKDVNSYWTFDNSEEHY